MADDAGDPKQCYICGKKLSRAHDVKRHKKKIHGIDHVPTPVLPKPPEKPKPKPPVKKAESKPLPAIAPRPGDDDAQPPPPVMMLRPDAVAQGTAVPVVVSLPQAPIAQTTIDPVAIAEMTGTSATSDPRHALPKDAPIVISAYDPKQCDICDRRLSRSQDVERHKRRVHNAELTPPAALQPADDPDGDGGNDSDATNQSSMADDSWSQPPAPPDGGATELATTFHGSVLPDPGEEEMMDTTTVDLLTAEETVARVTAAPVVIAHDSSSQQMEQPGECSHGNTGSILIMVLIRRLSLKVISPPIPSYLFHYLARCTGVRCLYYTCASCLGNHCL